MMTGKQFSYIFGGALWLIGIAMFAYSAYLWLRYGEWYAVSFIDVIKAGCNPNSNTYLWAATGGDWEGIRKILAGTPVFFACMVTGTLSCMSA